MTTLRQRARRSGPIAAALLMACGLLGALAVAGTMSARPGHKFGLPAPKPKPENAIRIASYNVLNLFDHADDPALEGEHDDIDMATADDRCRAIAAAIRSLNADIVALQEVESREALRWFRDTYLADMGYDYLASEDVGYYRGIEQSVMSRYPVKRMRTWPDMKLNPAARTGPGWDDIPPDERPPFEFQRSPLMVDVEIRDDYELTLFVVHHKSGRNRWKRELEALAIIDLVEARLEDDPSRNLMVLGDFNAAPWDKSLRLYLEAGLIDVMAHRIIPRWRNPDPEEPNLYKTHESDRVLDYILMNSAAHRELVIGSAHVVGTLYDDEYDWRIDPHPPGYASDHYPLVVDLIPHDRK